MKLIIDIPDYTLDDIQNGSIACGQILKAVKNGIPYEERPQGEWIEVGNNQPYSKDKLYGCSKCRSGGYLLSDTKNVNFCSNCGADMRI